MSSLQRGWAEVEVREVVQSTENCDPTKEADLPFRYIDIGSINNKTFSIENPKSLFGREAPSRAKRRIRRGDVLFSTVRTYLKNIALVPEDLDGEVTSTGIAVLRPSEAILSDFLFGLVRSEGFIRPLSLKQDGTLYPAITDSDLLNHRIPLPPLAEQKRIVAKLDALNAKSACALTELARIETLVSRYKQAVLSKAFSGELTREWNRLPLGDALNQAQVGLVRSKEQQFAGGGIPYVRMNHFDLEGRWHLEGITHVEASADDLRQFALQRGDVLFNTRNSFELVGKVAYWEGSQEAFLYNNNILRMRFEGTIDPKFAFFQMQSGPFRTYLESVKSATTSVCAIYQKALVKAPFAVPESLTEQHEIVRRIESAFAKIDRLAKEAKRALELVGKLDEAILAKAFRGELVPQDANDEPAEQLLIRIRTERDKAPKARRGRKAVGQ